MINPKISIIVPVYNVEIYLRECLDSIINQTLKNIEIICIDDGSTDNSLKILQEYGKKDERIKIFVQKNQGLSSTRNKGIKNAVGEYILFVDSDDYIDLKMCEELYGKCKKNDLDLILCQIHAFYHENREKQYRPDYELVMFEEEFENKVFSFRDLDRKLLFNIPVSACNKLFKREIIIKNSLEFIPGLTFEDNPFFYKFFLNSKRAMIYKRPFYFRRLRQGSITTKKDNIHFKDSLKVFLILKEIFFEEGVLDDFEVELYDRGIRTVLGRLKYISDKYKHSFFQDIKREFINFKLSDKVINQLNVEVSKVFFNVINSVNYDAYKFNLNTLNENEALKNEIENLKNEINTININLKSSTNNTLNENEVLKNEINTIKRDLESYNNDINSFNKKIDKLELEIFELKNEKPSFIKSIYLKVISKFPLCYIILKIPKTGLKRSFINYKGYKSIVKKDLFDESYYSNKYIDVKNSKFNPLLHYIYFGFKEKKSPNPSFNVESYLNNNKDVKKSKINPLVHYSLYGINEQRKI